VMMPYVSCSGVRLEASSSGTFVFWLKKRDVFSNFDRDPYGLTVAPSARGSAVAGEPAFERQATSAALQAAPRARNARRERVGRLSMAPILPTDVHGFVIYYIPELDDWAWTDWIVCGVACV